MSELNLPTYPEELSRFLTAQAALMEERVAGELTTASNLLPTTMIGTRPTVTLTFSPSKRAREEAEYVAGLSFWAKLYYRGFLRKLAD